MWFLFDLLCFCSQHVVICQVQPGRRTVKPSLLRSDFRCKRLLETEVCGCGCGRMQKAADECTQSFLFDTEKRTAKQQQQEQHHTRCREGDLILRKIEPENRNIVHFRCALICGLMPQQGGGFLLLSPAPPQLSLVCCFFAATSCPVLFSSSMP